MITIETLRARATKFAKAFEKAHSEINDGQNFIRDFCEIFGLNYRRAVSFEKKVKKLDNKRGRIDGFFPSLLLVEMKSAGKNLEEAYQQATGYFHSLKDEEMPLCVLVSDFQTLHLYNQETHAEPLKIKLAELPQHIEYFRFLEGFETKAIEKQAHINKEAAEKMADLHDAIKKTGYTGKDLETYLVRLLFCLFADNTGLFGENNQFLNYLTNYTNKDGSDLHGALSKLFDTLNLPDDEFLNKNPNYKDKKRLKNLPEHLNKFSYINGLLFEGILAECYFDETSRNTLIECAKLDWSEISPAIFGALFQAIMHFDDEQSTAKTKKRREFGAHYTSEENILKTINPLFMDDLRIEFGKCKNTKKQLIDFHHKLSTLNFFDPACGCGNFLIIAYRELRLLELEIIKALRKENLELDVSTLIKCDVDQFYGVDIDESAVQIATVAMWLTDHQMNLKVQQLGQYFKRTPLKKKANILQANALRMDWKNVISPDQCSFIMGNPPFVGSNFQTKDQKLDCAYIFKEINGAGVLDYVAAWHIKSAKYIQENQNIRIAFVSTNSLTQGGQVSLLWSELLKLKIRLHFAHRTFKWTNEGRGIAAVHCVILGFGLQELKQYRIFDYGNNISGEPIEIKATQINPYLVDAPTVLIEKRRQPLSENTPEMIYGSKPTDGGHLLLSLEEVDFIQQNDPIAAKYIRRFLGSEEFINNLPRFCLWLKESTAHDRIASPEIKKRMELVKKMRLESTDKETLKDAATPYLFQKIRQTDQPYLLIPCISSETRKFIPIGYFSSDVICGNANFMLPNATLYDFGMLCSTFHNAWMRTVCGRLESRYRYSNTIVYNNFPFPENVKPAIRNKIEEAAQMILDARLIEEQRCINNKQKYALAMLYAANNMPEELQKAHKALDKAVDAAYNYKGSKEDAARVAYLFELYQKVTSPLVKEIPLSKKRKKSKSKT